MKFKLTQLAALATLLVLSAQSQAGTVACPAGSITDPERDFQLTTAVNSTCLMSGDGNLQGQVGQDDFFTNANPSYDVLDKDPGDALTGQIGSWFDVSGTGSTSGSISINSALWNLYSALAVGFKAGTSNTPDWAVFGLASGTTSGTWLITPNQGGGLSHANLYGIKKTPDNRVPEPGSMALVGAALLATALASRRRRQS